jgi:hypothetical protein
LQSSAPLLVTLPKDCSNPGSLYCWPRIALAKRPEPGMAASRAGMRSILS